LKVLIDMNLSPGWVTTFAAAGIEAVHWATVGQVDADDDSLLEWARKNDAVVLTRDLDFGKLQARADTNTPSVVQIRDDQASPSINAATIVQALNLTSKELAIGAIVTVSAKRIRVTPLPINPR
jgi:predicted nuclease of predicted toxin-antitoxin system